MTGLLRKDSYPSVPAVTLKGFRIELRTPQKEDGPEWLKVRQKNKDFLKPYEPTWPADSSEPAFYRRRMERQASEWEAGRGQPFLIFLDGGNLIGGVNINNICRGAAQFASLGYWLDETSQGQGYMAEALQIILGYGFDSLRLHRFNAGCLPHNERSKKLLLKSGFREEGYAAKYMEIDGKWQDHVLFGISVEDWRGMTG